MAKISITLGVRRRWWAWPAICVGAALVWLGAPRDRVIRWLVLHAHRLTVNGKAAPWPEGAWKRR